MINLLLVVVLLLNGCSGVWRLNEKPIVLEDGSSITVVRATAKQVLGLGGSLTALYLFQHKDGDSKLIRADSSSAASALENLKLVAGKAAP